MSKMILRLVNAYLPPILWAVFIFLLSGTSQNSLPSFTVSTIDFLFKKLSHVFVYAVLYFLTYRGINIHLQRQEQKKKNWWIAVIICLIYATSDEIHQMFSPHRTPAFRDVGYDMLGVSIAFLRMYNYI
jgi:VanZ family protein